MQAFLIITFIHLLAVASPGPDFAIIVKQDVTQSRRTVLWTSLGIALGILVHVVCSLLGIGFIIAQSIVFFTIIKFIGAGYLIFIGWKALTAKHTNYTDRQHTIDAHCVSVLQALSMGFLCNALNPKATLFFLALFTQVIDPHTPLLVQLGYGIYMSIQTFVWFALLGSILSASKIRQWIDIFHVWIERVMGVLLIALGLKIALATRE